MNRASITSSQSLCRSLSQNSIGHLLIQTTNRLFGSRNYQKFIILGRSRVGSTLLVSYLDSHPNIRAEGELFQVLSDRNPADIFKQIWHKQHPGIHCAGFKLFYYHPSDSNDDTLWRTIASDKAVRIIHLKRANKLRSVVSKLIAMKTQQWTKLKHQSPDKKSNSKSVEISSIFLEQEFERVSSWEHSAADYFKDHPLIDILYEDLVSSTESEFKKITNFLGVKYCAPKTENRKQNPEPLRELITNYDELFEYFQGTKWEIYFH